MAGNSTAGVQVATGTLTANTADLVFLSGGGMSVKITNLTGAAPIWFTVSQAGGPCPVPTVGGTSGEFCAASVAGTSVSARGQFRFNTVVQLISSGTPAYMVELQGNHATS